MTRPTRRRRWLLLALGLLGVGAPGPTSSSRAQVIELPRTQLATPLFAEYLTQLDVALAADGSLQVVWSEGGSKDRIVSARYTANLAPLGGPVRVDTAGDVTDPVVAADGRGGFISVFRRRDFPWSLHGRLLDGNGQPSGSVFRADCQEGNAGAGWTYAVAALPSGFVVAYQGVQPPTQGARVCLLDSGGFPRGTGIQLGPFATGFYVDVAAHADGSFLVAWSSSDGPSGAQVFLPSGLPLGGSVPILDGAFLRAVAANPTGGWVVAGILRDGADDADDVWVQRIDADGTVLAPPHLAHEAPTGSRTPGLDVEVDEAGNVYVVWAESDHAAPRMRVRGFDAGGTPFGPALPVTTRQEGGGVRVARLPSGHFANLWPYDRAAWGNVVSLCTPGVSVCGDGVVVAQCELCDDGPANSDTVANACRTDCRPARCGDGTIDGGETCDDGNNASCDGCSASCGAEAGLTCGDGIVASGCGESCDDTNTVDGDGCSAACSTERIPGQGSPRFDCWSEWSVSNPTNIPFFDRRGAINFTQRCVDDDPRCDVDGGQPGSCTFQVRVCANNTDLAGCSPPTRLRTWTLVSPSPRQASGDPILAQVRAAFQSVPFAIVGPSTRDVCSPAVTVPVPLRGGGSGPKPGKLKLRAEALDYDDVRDKDQLRLLCLPGD